ncbi:hypothetical protein PoB_004524700 [Plakobranchus ocellatus]|uniref:Reverse transcriptase domain-containing protein n=1 Tax=Plakobranchus ocellatus TaxID=259542 RepID=A0AAV4BH89_9GAST|nr:hypothetical protein PoB_004524700 [Plakobranchus ocellatus]
MAGKGQESWANLVGPISVKVGPLSTQETIYVAQINDDMLLGMEYLDKYNAVIDSEDHTLQVQGQQIPLRTLVSDTRSKAYLKQRCLISPMSARRVGCQINTPLVGTILIEPRNGHDLIIPWVICKDQDTWIAQRAGAGAAAERGPGTPVTTGVARVGNVAVIGSTWIAQRAGAGAAAKRGPGTPMTTGVARVGNMAVIGSTWIAQRAGAGAAAKRRAGTPVTTGVARVGNVAVIGRKAPARDPVKAAIEDVMDKKDTPTTRGLGHMG